MFNRVHIDTGMSNKVSAANDIMTDFILSFTLVGREHLVALHEAKEGKIGTAKPLDKSSLLFLMNEVCADAPVEKWRDPRVLYQSASTLVWYRKASAKPERLWFRLAEKHFSIMAKLPTLIFMESGRELFVFAACTNQVNRTTPLYHAPFCNVYEGGSLCFGSVDRPDGKDSLEERMKKLEAALLESNFSHISCHKTFKALVDKKHDTNKHIALWKQFEKSGLSPKSKDMVKFGLTVEQMVTRLERK